MIVLIIMLTFNNLFAEQKIIKLKNPPLALYDGNFEMEINSNINLVIGDHYNHSLLLFSNDGSLLDTIAVKGKGPDEILGGFDLEIRKNKLYVTQIAGRLSIFSFQAKNKYKIEKSIVLEKGRGAWFTEVDNSGNLFTSSYKAKIDEKGELQLLNSVAKYSAKDYELKRIFFKPPDRYKETNALVYYPPALSIFNGELWLFGILSRDLWIYDLSGELKRKDMVNSQTYLTPEMYKHKSGLPRDEIFKRQREWENSWTPLKIVEEDSRGNRILQYSKRGGEGYFLVGFNREGEQIFKDIETEYRLLCSDEEGNFYFFDGTEKRPIIRVFKLDAGSINE